MSPRFRPWPPRGPSASQLTRNKPVDGRLAARDGARAQRGGQVQAAPGQALPRALACLGQPAGDRPLFPAQLRRLGLALALQAARYEGGAILLGESLDLLGE